MSKFSKGHRLVFFSKEQIINLTRGLYFYSGHKDTYDTTFWEALLDYLDYSTDNRNEDDYDDFDSSIPIKALEVYLIVKVDKKKQYLKVNETDGSFIFVDNINDCSVFNILSNNALDYNLTKVRLQYPDDKFIAQSINVNLLNEPLLNLI